MKGGTATKWFKTPMTTSSYLRSGKLLVTPDALCCPQSRAFLLSSSSSKSIASLGTHQNASKVKKVDSCWLVPPFLLARNTAIWGQYVPAHDSPALA